MDLDIPASDSTPRVFFDRAMSTLLIAGESYPENVAEFYGPLRGWLDEYPWQDAPLKLVLKLFYLNTGSTKALLDILRLLSQKREEGAQVEIEWLYLSDVELMRQAGEELLSGAAVPYRIEASAE